MGLIRKPPRQDPVKSAIYNPREFRGSGLSTDSSGSSGSTGFVWLAMIVLTALISTASYFRIGDGTGQAQAQASASILPKALIPTGAVKRLRQEPAGTVYAPLKLMGSRYGKHCMFRLEDWQTGAPVLAIFVRAGDTTETLVPLGQYRGQIACGATWYGAQLFGAGSTQEELSAPAVFFQNASGEVHGVMIQLR